MVYTITLNPALDYTVYLPSLICGEVNRAESERIYPGGKGINVSIVLNNLGVETCALGFIAGIEGREIQRLVAETGTRTDFIELHDGSSRINIKLRAGEETEINARGPVIAEKDIAMLFSKLDVIKDTDILVLSGSFQQSVPRDIYAQIIKRVHKRNIRVAIDAPHGMLDTLKYHPFLIKPNKTELCEMFGESSLDEDGVLYCARLLHERGAQNVLVSLGAEGALLVDEFNSIHRKAAPVGRVINTVGAGDSMVAGFIAGYLRSNDIEESLNLALAAGSATAFSEWLATGKQIRDVYNTHDAKAKDEECRN